MTPAKIVLDLSAPPRGHRRRARAEAPRRPGGGLGRKGEILIG
ncbi:MAG: hypothetical protein WDM81_19040 [Rhizomicrobium sp.]